MNNPRVSLLCLALLPIAMSLVACKSGGATEPPTGQGGSGGAPTSSGGASGTGGIIAGTGGTTAGSGGSSQTGGVMGTGGASQGTGGAPPATGGSTRAGGSLGSGGTLVGSGGRTASTLAGTGGAAGGKGTGGSTASAGLTLYYIRHAEVVANTVEPSQITTENMDALTDLGLRQIEALTTYLQGLGVTPDAILVSPHVRAQRTIEPYLIAKNLTGEVWMELAEASDKTSTGAPLPPEPKYYAYYKATIEVKNLVFRDPAATKFWQNDNYESGLLMVATAKKGILERYSQSGKTIFVVGHAIAGQLLIGLLRGDDLTAGPATTGSSAVYILNTGVMRLLQDPSSGLFKLDGRNSNNPATK